MQRQLGAWYEAGIIPENPPYHRLGNDIREFFKTVVALKAEIAEELARALILFCINDELPDRERLKERLVSSEISLQEQIEAYIRRTI